MYPYTTKLYPTVLRWVSSDGRSGVFAATLTALSCFLRQSGMGHSALVAWLGVAISPLVMLPEGAWHKLPAVASCAVALGTGLLPLLLRETLHTRLAELTEDIEKPRQKGNGLKERSR